MKKVLSVLLAAAMVMGMSVTSMAKTWGSDSTDVNTTTSVTEFDFYNEMYVYDKDGAYDRTVNVSSNDESFDAGDKLYFWITKDATATLTNATDFDNNGFYTGVIDEDWSINISADGYVKKAYFVAEKTYELINTTNKSSSFSSSSTYLESTGLRKLICVELDKGFDAVDDDLDFRLYIADQDNKEKSAKIIVSYDVDTLSTATLYEDDFDFTIDVSVGYATKYTVDEDVTKETAVFDFDDEAYYTTVVYGEQVFTLNLSQAYDSDVDALFDYDADLDFLNFKGTGDSFSKVGELFIPASKDNKFIYEIVDGELVAVEAEYDAAYKVAGLTGTKKGYVIETKELGYYVISDIEMEIEEEVEVEVEDTTSTDKANPETGANDFVGAAVALAVVSVAAAGALALKK